MPEKKVRVKLTNRQFAKKDKLFNKACVAAGIKATVRQASKYCRKVGLAYAKKF